MLGWGPLSTLPISVAPYSFMTTIPGNALIEGVPDVRELVGGSPLLSSRVTGEANVTPLVSGLISNS